MPKAPIRERHHETQRLADVLATLPENSPIDYASLAQLSNLSVVGVKRRYQTARRIALHDRHVLIETVRGIGVVRIPQDGVNAPVTRHLNRARSAAKRGKNTIKHGITDFEKLPRDVKTQTFVQQAQLGALMLFTSKRARKRLGGAVETANGKLDVGRSLEVMKGSLK